MTLQCSLLAHSTSTSTSLFPSPSLCSPQLVDYFSGGQHCDETQGTRGSEVHIQCCNGLHVNSPNDNIVNRVDSTGAGEGHDAFEVRT
jgi:hypothetical protein